MISFELIPRSVEHINKQLNFLNKNNYFDIINVPDILRFNIRSWETDMKNFNIVPHIRTIDFDLKNDKLKSIVKNYKHILLISGEKNLSFGNQIFSTNVPETIKYLKNEFPNLIISVAIDQYRSSLKEELTYLEEKLNSGADYIFSQPFFNINQIKMFYDYIDKNKLFVGISPVLNDKNLSYWNNVNNVVFNKDFDVSMEYNVNLAKEILNISTHTYFMPINTDYEIYFNQIFK